MGAADWEDQFVDYFRARAQSLRRLAYSLSGDWHTAEDLVQQTFVRLYRRWPAIRDETVDAYARQALVNAFLSHRRARRRESLTADPPEREAGGADPADGLVVRRALAGLAPRQRAAVVRIPEPPGSRAGSPGRRRLSPGAGPGGPARRSLPFGSSASLRYPRRKIVARSSMLPCHPIAVDEQLDRLGVQLAEARRMAQAGGVPRGRLALLLVDNAAEILLRMSASAYLTYAEWEAEILRSLERLDRSTPGLQEQIEHHSKLVVSNTRRRKIDNNFNELVDYVFEQDDWPLDSEWAICIKILHKYRNEAYHNDKVQGDVLDAAVVVYFYLVAHLLKSRKSVLSLLDVPPPGVLELLEGEDLQFNPGALLSNSSKRYAQLMADRILHDFAPNHVDICYALSRHLIGRLDQVERNLKEVSDFHDEYFPHPDFAVRLVQCADSEWYSPEPPNDFWVRDFKVRTEDLEAWRTLATDLAEMTDVLEALRTFALREETMAHFEGRAAELAQRIDQQVQRQIDMARGK
ncbi:sigma factor [Actinoplanes missouriensis]|uniref:sigma factor n=1 Tax=Actinoplanes missouriensis TaxID=1866 RepID=UPI0033C71BC6